MNDETRTYMLLVSLLSVIDEGRYGGKAAQLSLALRAGLPVPAGFALDDRAAERVLLQPAEATEELACALTELGGLVAVRSSAVGEDSATASFAGQHLTVLGVTSSGQLLRSIADVLASGSSEAALGYRRKLGLEGRAKMGVVIQRLIRSDVAGVLFTQNPVTFADERVIEAAWGLGETVVQGLVNPDRFRLERGGPVIERVLGDKDVAIRWSLAGGTEEVAVSPEQASLITLDDPMLGELDRLATRCESLFGGTQDIEFAFEQGELFLLQRRAITRG
jgi:pyruvate,water dikinase